MSSPTDAVTENVSRELSEEVFARRFVFRPGDVVRLRRGKDHAEDGTEGQLAAEA